MTLRKIVRTATVAGTSAALVLATGVTASAHHTSGAAAATTTVAATTPQTSERFGDFLMLLASLPEFQGKTLDQIKAEILAAIQAQQAAEAAAEAAEKAAEAQAEAAEKAAEAQKEAAEAAAEAAADAQETDGDNNNEENGDVEDQHDVVKTKPVTVAATKPKVPPRESSSTREHEHDGGHDR